MLPARSITELLVWEILIVPKKRDLTLDFINPRVVHANKHCKAQIRNVIRRKWVPPSRIWTDGKRLGRMVGLGLGSAIWKDKIFGCS